MAGQRPVFRSASFPFQGFRRVGKAYGIICNSQGQRVAIENDKQYLLGISLEDIIYQNKYPGVIYQHICILRKKKCHFA